MADRFTTCLRRSRTQPSRVSALAAALATALVSSSLMAQPVTTERRLTDTGEWTVVEAPAVGTPERALATARQALADQRYEQAERLAEDWIERYPAHPLLPEALLVRGDSLMLRREYYKSLYDYEKIAREHYGSEAYAIALEREFYIATLFASGVKRKIWGMRIAKADDEAETLFILIQERSPGSKLAEKAGRALADFYFRRRDMDLAAITYDLYVENHPSAADRAEAMKRLVYSHLATYRGPAFDPSGLYEARSWLDRIQVRFPAEAQQMGAEALQRRIDESDARQMLELAEWYYNDGDPVSARFLLERLLRRYPDSVAAGIGYDIMEKYGWLPAPPDPAPANGADVEPPSNPEPDSPAPENDGAETPVDDDA